MESNFLDILAKQKQKFLDLNLGEQSANIARTFFRVNFEEEGWDDEGFQKWATPKRKIPGTKENREAGKRLLGRKKKKKDNISNVDLPILQQKRKLKKALFSSDAVNVKKTSKETTITIKVKGSQVPYAAPLNYGADKINLPARPFLYQSATLDDKIKQNIINQIKQAFKV